VPALAQDDDDEETFIVTGSRIARSDVTSENPVTIISGDALRSTGMSNLGESLRQTLAAGSGGFNQSSILSGGGATSIDLRNLGANRVLLLINGRRVADFADSLANRAGDLSLIPTAMVERVEILRDGASTAYGADAVSGVVNVILKSEFEGLTVSSLVGISHEGDGEQVTLSTTMGGNFERGNIVVSLEYRFNDEVMQHDREFAFPAISSLGSSYNNGSFFSPGGVLFATDTLFSTTGITCTIPKAFGGDETTVIGGAFPPFSNLFAALSNCPSFLSAPAGNGRNSPTRYDYSLQQNMFGGSQIFGAAFYGTYDITDNVTAFMEFQANNRESNFRLDGNPGLFTVSGNNPYLQAAGLVNPFQADPDGNPLTADGLAAGTLLIRPTTTVGPRQSTIDATILRSVTGLQGDDLFGRFSWEVSYLWTKLNSQVLTNSVYNPVRWSRIMDPAACRTPQQNLDIAALGGAGSLIFGVGDPSGLCDAALVAAGKGSFTLTTSDDALDPLRPGSWSESEIAYFRQRAISTSVFETSNWFASISGEIVDLPAGPLGFAVGYEFREEQGFNKPDSVTEAGESVANQVFTTSGAYDVSEFFGELNIPILSGMQWAEELTVNLQGRWFDYSNFGDDTVWKVGVNYQLNPDLRFRFSQGTAFRAPTIVNLFGGGTASFDFYTDPCDASSPLQADPNVVANCAFDGVPGGYVQFAGQVNVLAGSNPNLEPETADTLSFGIAFTPRFLPNLSATIDWWQISLENLITRPTTDSIIDNCLQATSNAAFIACRTWVRHPNPTNSQPLGIVNQLVNSASVRTDGLDWQINYFWDQMGGVFTLTHGGTYVFENTFYPGEGGADDRGSIPMFKANAVLDYARNDWSVQWQMNIVGDTDDPRFDGINRFSYDGPEEHVTHTVRGRYQYNNYAFLMGVSNLFDEEPPYVFGTGNNTDLFTYSGMGRYYFARVTADF
jgi:iron complex outermembrane receptor protein